LSWRTFISIDIEDSDVLERIRDFQDLLAGTRARLTLVRTENVHITLWFLGDISPGLADRICDVLRSLRFRPFVIELSGVGAFPSLSRPRVIWAGVGRGSKELEELHGQLRRLLGGLGFRPDPKGFKPHVTIARVKRATPALVELVSENSERYFGSLFAEEVRLKRSVLTPRGPIYSTICSVGPSKESSEEA